MRRYDYGVNSLKNKYTKPSSTYGRVSINSKTEFSNDNTYSKLKNKASYKNQSRVTNKARPKSI